MELEREVWECLRWVIEELRGKNEGKETE